MYTLSPQQNSPKRILFHLLVNIYAAMWISCVEDGFRWVVLLRIRGSLDYARDDGTVLRVVTRVDINHLSDFRYTQKRSICAIALDMPTRA